MAEYIDRQAAMEGLKQYFYDEDMTATEFGEYWYDTCVLEFLEDMPPADVRPVRWGHWIEHTDPNGDPYYECSACHGEMVCIEGTPQDNEFFFCNFCGADMREEEQNGSD